MKRLYKILGVGERAGDAEIKSAYRRKAKALHPDAGGSADEFADLSKAFHVLSDATRRLTYDQTGMEDEAPKAEDVAVAYLRNLVESFIAADADPLYTDFAGEMIRQIDGAINEATKVNAATMRKITRCEKMAARFQVKRGDNVVKAILEGRIREMRQHLSVVERDIQAMHRAKELAGQYSYRMDPRPQQTHAATYYYQGLRQQAQNATGWMSQ